MKGSKKVLKKPKRQSKKQKGGVSFNSEVNFATLGGNYYPYNNNINNPQDPKFVTDARLLNCSTAESATIFGGKKHRKNKKHLKKTKGKKHVKIHTRRKRKQKGGSINPLGYSFLTGISTENGSVPISFGSTAGTDYMEKTLMAKEIPSNKMGPESTLPTIA
tara:strand:- start:8457 stop:8942 length:486 start_codon:yes stop_codon:yes gene_type:complete